MLRLSFRSMSVATLLDRCLNGPHPQPLSQGGEGSRSRLLTPPSPALGEGGWGDEGS